MPPRRPGKAGNAAPAKRETPPGRPPRARQAAELTTKTAAFPNPALQKQAPRPGTWGISVSEKPTRCKEGNSCVPDAPVYRVAVPASRGAPWGGACVLRPLPLLRLAVSVAGGARLRSPLDSSSTKFYGKSRNRPMASYTICRKISLYVLPASAHVRRWQRILNLFDSL